MNCFVNQKPALLSIEALEESKIVALDYYLLGLKIDQTIQMIESGGIKDGKTIMLLQHLQLKDVFSS